MTNRNRKLVGVCKLMLLTGQALSQFGITEATWIAYIIRVIFYAEILS